MEHNYSTVQLNEWREYKLIVERFSGNWAFRGQADAGWVLNNAIERTAFIHFRKRIEEDFVSEFQRGARNYLSKDETPEHLIEWLALMQHHGAPTRLLDLTRSLISLHILLLNLVGNPGAQHCYLGRQRQLPEK